MAILGEAHIIVRAITDGVGDDIKRAFDDSGVNNAIKKNTKAMKGGDDQALNMARAFHKLNRVSMSLQGGIGALLGGVSALVSGGIIPLIATLGQAATSGVALVGVFAAVKVGTMVAKSALKGVSQAASAASTGNSAYAKTLKEVREEMQQLAFDAEDAALGEKRAALNLEKAREELMRVQDLPPNDRARREAELAYEETELAFRRAKDRNSDLQDQINNPPKGKGGAGTDPFKDLTKSQKVFAQYLVSIKGGMKDLREAAASGFLPMLQKQINRVIKGPTWKTLLVGYNEVGTALGKAAKNFVDALTKGNNIDNLKEFFRMAAGVLPKLGSVLGSVFGVFLGVMKAATPLIQRFTTWLAKAANHLNQVVSLKSNSGQLTKFFDRAGTMAGQFVRIFKNWFAGLGAMFGSAVGPGSGGQKLLDWLERASERYKHARTTFSGKLLNEKSLSQSADNFIELGTALTKIAGAFKGLGTAGASAAFTEIARSAPYIHEILINAVRTGKAFGRVVAAVIKLISAFSDAGQASIFLDVIANNLAFIANIMKALQPALNVIGPIFGIIAAFAVLAGWGAKLLLLFKGFAAQLVLGAIRLRILKVETVLAGGAFQKLGISAKTAGAAIKTSLASNLVTLALMAVFEVIMAISTATDAMNQGLQDTARAAIEAGRSGGQVFDSVTASIPDAGALVRLKGLNASLKLIRSHKRMGETDYIGMQIDGLKNGLEAYGVVLSELAGTDLEKAQESFAALIKEKNLDNYASGIALSNMPEYRKKLVEQADALGINIRNLDGTVNGVKQLEFAQGKGEIATMRAAAAAKEFSEKIAGAAAEVINMGDAVKDATDKNGKINVEKLIGNLKKQAQDAAAYYKNLISLQGRNVGQPVIDAIIGMGAKEGSAAAAALAAASDKDLAALKGQYAEVGNLTSDEMTARLTEAGPAVRDVFKHLGEVGMSSFIDSILTTKDLAKARAKFLGLMNANGDGIKYSFDTTGKMHAVDKSGKTLYAKGGLVRPMRLAGGSGNPLQGFGGPQSDSIAAYLSPGEFVMNSSAVSRFLPTLQAMNQTSFSNNRLNSTVPAAQAPAPPSSNVSIVVNPAPGMNEVELAQRVAVEMARQMRRGSF